MPKSFSPNGNSLRYSWNFGDGAIESGKSSVSHSFSKPGTYSVQLTVTDQATRLSSSSSFSVDVTVLSIDKTKPPKNEKPKPVIQYALDTVNPLNVTFDGTSSTDDGTIVSYRWQIADENHEHRRGSAVERTGVQFDYSFPRAGSYTVRLTVKDNQGAEAATERVVSTADMSGLVRDESLFGPKKYYSKKKVVESFTLESPRLAVLKIKNADGLEHPIESCSSTPWPEKLGCLFQNSVNRAYIALYRVSKAEVFINGQRVTDRIGKHTAYFETVVSLQTSNTIEIRTKGWPSAFIELELQSVEVNEAPIVYVTHSGALRGIPQTIEFDASTSVDMNDHIMSYRFQALNAAGAVAIDTDWQAASYAALEFTERGTFTVVVSARDTFGAVGTKSVPITIESNQIPLVTASYVVLSNQAPYQVRVTATASDPDGDAIQYNFAYSTGQVSGFQDSPQGLTSFAAAGTYSVDVTARDVNGGTATFTLPITVGGNLLPIANFDFVTDRGGYAPLTIIVDASPSSDPDDATETLRYFWTFGDNSPRVEGKILSHTFINQGQYTVTLSVLDPKRGLSTKSRAAFAWRTTPPNPVLIANPRVGPASLTVDFDASQSTPGASPIASYLLDYNDGTFESSLTPFKTHTFTQPGIYNVGLIVYDTDGNGNIGGQTIYVFDGKKPSAAIQVVSSDVITPARFELQGSGVSPNPLATITDYKWTLPNGTVQTGPSLIYTTSTNGNFAIKLEVKDSYGYWSDPATLDLSAATGTLPIAQITADKTRIALGQAVKLSGLNSYTSNGQANLVSYEWTLPNGNKIYGPEKTVTLSATGLKTISLIVTDSKGYVSSPATIQIQVDARQTPVPAISMTTSGTVVPVTAFLNGLQSTTPNPGATITGYEWKIEAPDSVPQINFSLFGAEVSAQLVVPYTHTISLRVFDSAGAVSGWISRTFGPLVNNPPIAVVTPSAVIAKAPATVILSAIESTDPDGHNIINAHWLFSDGTDFQGLIATHEFPNTGTYSATVRVQDQYGAWSDPVTVPITLNANLPPVALMTSVSDANNKFNFTFDASTSFDLDGTIARYDWFFSDGFISLGAGPTITHAFPTAGTWRAGVNVFDNNGAMTTIRVSVEVAPSQTPVADITVLPTSTDPKGLSFKFSGAGSTVQTENSPQFTWNFGDQTPQVTGIDVDKTFAEEGLYSVILTIRNQDGASASKTLSFYAYDHAPKILQAVLEAGSEHANSYFGQTAIQREVAEIPALIKFSAANSKASVDRVLSYTWDFGDGSPLGYGIETQHRYVKPGVFTARLTIKDQDGNEASDTTAFGLSDVNCAFRESDSTCLILSGTNDLIIDEQQNSFSLEITGAENLDPALATEDNALELLLDNEKLIDLKGQFSISGRQFVVQTAAIQPYVYDGAEFTIQLNGRSTTQNDVWATLRKLRFSAGSINATLPSGIKLLEVAGADYLKTFANPGTSLTLSALPRGPYTFTATFPDENVVTKSVDVTSGLATIDLTAPQITSLQMKTMMKAATLPESDEIQRLSTRPWPSVDYVASLKPQASVSMKSAQLVTQQATSSEVTNVYKNACGQSAPYAVVTTSINQIDNSSTIWSDFLSNNPGATPDPNAKLFKPLSTISSGEPSVHVLCHLQAPSMQHQFNQWYRSSSRQCCDPNESFCNMMIDQTYAYLTKDYARDDQPVVYQIKFKDVATGNIVTRSSSFTFNSVTAAQGYSRSNMTSILGLPANDFVDGWSVPHEFDIPIPKGMSDIEYAIDIQSTYPNERYTHAYYCWTGKRIQPIVKVGLSTPIDDPVIIQPLISKLSQSAVSMSSNPVNSSEMPIEHDSRLGEPRANMARFSTNRLFPIEIDPRGASNTYPTYSASNNPYEIDVKVEIEVTEYGSGKNGYIPIKHIAMTPTSNYIPADGIVQTRRIGVETLLTDVSCLPNLNKTYCSGRLRI
ncbi:MAG: PKD domain-containing protein [Bdellovibrionales bacterium]|nr:PKD domain-containing protein [Bdellovibrionales bacterium]